MSVQIKLGSQGFGLPWESCVKFVFFALVVYLGFKTPFKVPIYLSC